MKRKRAKGLSSAQAQQMTSIGRIAMLASSRMGSERASEGKTRTGGQCERFSKRSLLFRGASFLSVLIDAKALDFRFQRLTWYSEFRGSS